MKSLFIGLITLFGVLGLSTNSYAVGLTVKPSSLRVSVPWGDANTTQLLVTNTADAPGMYQVGMEPASAGSVVPDGFRLAPGESQLLTVKAYGRWYLGSVMVAVAALPLDSRGVAVGSGVKIPLQVDVILPWWLVSLAWVLPLLAVGGWWARRRRTSVRSLPTWVVVTIAAVTVASGGLVGLLAIGDWPVRSASQPSTMAGVNTAQTHRLTIDDGSGTPRTWEQPVDVHPATAFTLTQGVAKRQAIELAVRDYGSLGVLLTGIGQVHNDVRTKHYWYLWVNGQFARTSASNITLTPGDHVEWRYISEMKPEEQ